MFFNRKRLRLYLFALLFFQVLIGLSCWKFVKAGTLDFRLLYTSGHFVRAGEIPQMYDYDIQRDFQNRFVTPRTNTIPMMEPPFVALLFFPLAFLTFLPAYFAFLAVNLLLLCVAVMVMRPYLYRLSDRMPSAPALLFITFFPVGLALAQGQLSLILLAVFCLSFAELQRGKSLLAGAILSLALVKFQIAFPVALLFLLWRQWRFVAGFSAGGAVLGGISIAILGVNHFADYWHTLFSTPATLSSAALQDTFGVYPQRIPNLYGLFYTLSAGARWSIVLTVTCSVLLLIWAARKPASLPLATLVALLVSYHLYLHDLSLLLLPISIFINKQFSSQASERVVSWGEASASRMQRWSGIAAVSSVVLLLITPLTLFLIGKEMVPLLVIPILIATLTLGPGLDRTPADGERVSLDKASPAMAATA